MEGASRQERVCEECDSGEVEELLADGVRSLEIPTSSIGGLDETTQ